MEIIKGEHSCRTALRLGVLVFISTFGFGIFAFAFPLLALRDNIGGGWLGAAFSCFFLAKLIIAPVAGPLADRFGPRPLLIGASLIDALAPLVYFLNQSFETLYLIQFLLGLAGGIFKPVAMAAIGASIPKDSRGRVFGWLNTACSGAFFVAPILGGLLFYDRDLTPVVLALLLCKGVALLGVLFLLPEGTATHRKVKHVEYSAPVRPNWPLMLAIFSRTLGIGTMITFYPMLLASRLLGPNWLAGLLFAIPSLISFLALPLGGRLADACNRRMLSVFGMSIAAFGVFLVPQAVSLPFFITIGVLNGFGSALSFPATIAQATDNRCRHGQVMGLLHGASNAGFITGPLLCGFLVERAGDISVSFRCAGVIGLIFCLPLLVGELPGGVRQRMWSSLAPMTVVGLVVFALLFAVTGGKQMESRASSVASLEATNKQTYAGLAMGNVVHMTVHAKDRETCDNASSAAFDIIRLRETDFSHRNRNGSIGRANLAAGSKPVPITPESFALIRRALDIGARTGGTFDITVGAVTSVPFYYREKAEQDKKALVDYRKVVLDEQARTVFLPLPGMALDLGGLAKGTIVDSAARELRKHGVEAGLVEAGGDFYCFGDRDWTIGIQNPRGEELLGTIQVRNAGVCGSGDYYQFAISEDDGKRKHHIIDPVKFDSAEASIAVTVIAPSAELADALSTTMFILGPDKGEPVIDLFPEASALWVLPDRTIHASKNFPDLKQ